MSAIPERSAVAQVLPSGTLTFAFTDIEGSTQRWERDRAAMTDTMRRHDALMLAALSSHGGHVFKTVGDAFCAAFSRPEDAVAAVLDAQRALVAEDFSSVDGLRVRAAIHTGTADERDGDYFGPAVNRVARLLAVGHGGQVLLSGVCADLVQGELPPQATLRDLGEHRLKDLARPEYVYQLLAPELRADFPPLRSLNALPNNLPLALTSFVGRETEIAEITALLETHRLVTLVGSGGIGKTRTSLQVAANLLDGSGDGVWFIELAPLTSGAYIPSTVAQALGVTLASEGDPVENLARALKPKRALLVFDNCEHLIEPAAHALAALLRSCPNVKMLASSRQALDIAGEIAYRVPPLGIPGEGTSVTQRETTRYAALALFRDRARAVDQHFALSDENAPIVADICRRLDGIPLAIELAAARVKILSPRQLRERLDERFRVLTGGNRDVLPRQQTLRALIDWSYDLLDERERTLFRRLGIFVNGFTLEGATAVGSGADLDELELFDLLASLVDKSLVLAEPAGDALRYRLLESTRAYAGEKLVEAGEREQCACRHLRYLHHRFAAVRERYERTARSAEFHDELALELEDMRAALEWAASGPDATLGGELLADIDDEWRSLGAQLEGLARLEAFLAAHGDAEPRLLARLWTAIAILAGASQETARALEAATQAVAHARASGGGATLAEALRRYSVVAAWSLRLDVAAAALDEAEAISGASAWLRLGLLDTRAFLSVQRGDGATAARAYEQLRKEHRRLGNGREERIALLNLAEAEHRQGQTPRAIALLREILPALRMQSDQHHLANALVNLAGYLVAIDDLPGTCAAAREAIEVLAPRDPGTTIIAAALEHLALALALGGDLPRAATLAGYAEAALKRRGFERGFTETTTHNRLTALLRERLALGELARLCSEGAALTPESAIALALEEP